MDKGLNLEQQKLITYTETVIPFDMFSDRDSMDEALDYLMNHNDIGTTTAAVVLLKTFIKLLKEKEN